MRLKPSSFSLLAAAVVASSSFVLLQAQSFHNAPAAAQETKNPYAGQEQAAQDGKQVYARTCALCHGATGQGTGNVPPLVHGPAQTAPDGAIFWYITKGDVDNGMPSWAGLPEQQRWQVVTYIKSLNSAQPVSAPAPSSAAPASVAKSNAPPPTPPFTDYRFEKPGTVRHITLKDLPEPFATDSATNGPKIVARPENAWPTAPEGFKVELYATGLNNPRLMRTAPNGDIFLAETNGGEIKVFRGITPDGKPEQVKVFATGLNIPFGIAFYPPGPDPQWVYVANMDSVVRFPYHNGDMTSSGPSQHLDNL
ncbi:MAG: cytochrome c, class, partial [Acidobacteriaceae bacterium]|nr:cytochrome c, class [Acidobacteriaceae bacterium]